MNSKFIASAVVALSALTGASAFAQSNLNGEAALAIRPVASTSLVTRAQVQNDNVTPGQNGEAAAGAWARKQSSVSTATRAEVRNDAVLSARGVSVGNSSI